MADRIQVRRDTEADWESNDPTLAAGEIGFVSDTDEVVVGDGSTAFTSLPRVKLDGPKGPLAAPGSATADQTGITTETDLTGLSVTADPGAGRRVKVTVQAVISNGTTDGVARLRIYQGASQIQLSPLRFSTSSAIGETITSQAIVTPTTGSKTWKATLEGVTGTVALRAASGAPAHIVVEDIGPA